MKNQSLYDIMQAEDPKWLQTIIESTDVAWLNKKEARAVKPGRKAIIKARIERLTYLAVI
jgi:hypothetical protein